jgi:glutamyl-tRNA synthetase
MKESNNTNVVITRFAPSPTGFMHIGNVRTAIFAYLFAKKHNGKFILRIEDTDKEREVSGSENHIIESLQWLGIDWDYGPDTGGPAGLYRQSERLDTYMHYAQKLIDAGYAYPDPYTPEELELFRKESEENKKPFLFRNHRPTTFDSWDKKRPLRFRVPEIKKYAWHDIVFGDLSAGEDALDDFVLIKSDGFPTYNFAHIVDDIEMGITHVIRGQEYVSSTPKFLAVYEALGVQPPHYACMPHIMAPGGNKKLGKRDGARDILSYRDEGYLPETMLNFLSLLGWNPGGEQEIFTRDEIIQIFTLEKVQKSGAQINSEKLLWMNKEHLHKKTPKERSEYYRTWIPEKYTHMDSFEETFIKIFPLLEERVSVGADIYNMEEEGDLEYLFVQPQYTNNNILVWKKGTKESTLLHLQKIQELCTTLQDWSSIESIKGAIFPYADEQGRGDVLWPLRVALSGKEKSPDPFTLAYIAGKQGAQERINYAINLLSQ